MKQNCWIFEKINKIDKPLANLTKTSIKIGNKQAGIKQTPRKSRESLGTTLKTYIQMNWKI
jgi:hypothetical protein